VYSVGGAVYGCAAGHGSYRLGSAQNCIRSARAGPVVLNGTITAYGLESCGVDTGSSELVVQRLTDGRHLRTVAATVNRVAPESYSAVTSLVLKRDGAVAWIAEARSIIRNGVDIEVHRADKRGEAELDSGTSIDPTSLRLRGSDLSWHAGASTRSATLV
jgi:hypothetical protein